MSLGRKVIIAAFILLGMLASVVVRAQMAPQAKSNVLDDATLAADDKIIAEIKDHNEIMSNLEYLSDMIGQRLTGSENLKKANDWTKERFAAYGVDNPHLESWQIAHTWTRGTARGRILSPAEHPLSIGVVRLGAGHEWRGSRADCLREGAIDRGIAGIQRKAEECDS